MIDINTHNRKNLKMNNSYENLSISEREGVEI